MTCVLDCSTAFSWVLPGKGNAETGGLLDEVAGSGAIVPALWPLDVGNVLLAAQRRGRITIAERHQAIAILGDLPIKADGQSVQHAWGDTLNLAASHDLTIHDACYPEASMRLGLPDCVSP